MQLPLEAGTALPVGNGAQGTTPAKLYFAGPVVDHLLIGGLSLVLLTLAYALHRDARGAHWVVVSLPYFTTVFNYPHFAATSYRLYHSRQNIAQYPVTAIGVPLLLVGAVAASFAQPDAFAPYFVKLMLLWSPYHFAGQSLGISLLYARRSGLYVQRWERFALSATLFGVYFMMQSRGEANSEVVYNGVVLPFIVLPRAVVVGCTVAFVVAVATFLAVVARWLIRTQFRLPPIVLLPTVTLLAWFILAPRQGEFQPWVPLFHSLQYLLIAWGMQLREKLVQRASLWTRSYAVVETLRWCGVNFAGGALLFEGLPRAVAVFGVGMPLGKAVIWTAIQIHHFFVDGVIWKLKSPKVSTPLQLGAEELGAPPR